MSVHEVAMPSLSDSMEEGTILKWMLEDGTPVARGQELVEIETDKASMVHVAEADGTLEILAAEGTTLPVGALIARIGAAVLGAQAPASSHTAPTPAPAPPEPASNGAAPPGDALKPATATIATNANGAVGAPEGRSATPLARRMARVHEVELAALTGTGPRGRITRADVLAAAGVETAAAGVETACSARTAPARSVPEASVGAARPAATRVPAEGARGEVRRLPASRQQQLIARRMAEAKATIPHFQVQCEVAMDAAIALRAELKATTSGAVAPSLNDLVVKACALALREHPAANGSYVNGGFELHGRVNIGVAVAAEDTLVVPVLKDTDTKSLGSIAGEIRRLAERVRTGEISPPELSGGTFTVSNLGMFGMTAITPVINPPQAAILGVGALRETLARVQGRIVDLTLMTLTLSCDHRILYGADAAWLLSDIRQLLEAPLALAL